MKSSTKGLNRSSRKRTVLTGNPSYTGKMAALATPNRPGLNANRVDVEPAAANHVICQAHGPPEDAHWVADHMALNRQVGMRLLQLRDVAVSEFTEGNWLEIGLLTGADDLVRDHPRLLRSLSWGDADYADCALSVLTRLAETDPDNVATIENYVALKFEPVGDNISTAPSRGRKIVFAPSVFDVPTDPVNPKLVSVMMPFDKAFTPIYDAIKSACLAAQCECQRADDIWEHSAVIQDVVSLICRSAVVVVDFSGRNANVFYETGIAHTLGKHVVPISQSAADVPFDVSHHRYVHYLDNGEGRQKLAQQLTERLRYLTAPANPFSL